MLQQQEWVFDFDGAFQPSLVDFDIFSFSVVFPRPVRSESRFECVDQSGFLLAGDLGFPSHGSNLHQEAKKGRRAPLLVPSCFAKTCHSNSDNKNQKKKKRRRRIKKKTTATTAWGLFVQPGDVYELRFETMAYFQSQGIFQSFSVLRVSAFCFVQFLIYIYIQLYTILYVVKLLYPLEVLQNICSQLVSKDLKIMMPKKPKELLEPSKSLGKSWSPLASQGVNLYYFTSGLLYSGCW